MTIISDSPNNYIAITPIVINSMLSLTATRLYIALIYDNLSSQATLGCVLTDNSKIELYNTQLVMSGTDYSNWTGDSTYAFTFACTNLGIIAI